MKQEEILNFKNLEIRIKYKKIRNIILKVKENQAILLSVPNKIKKEEILRFLDSRINWILIALDKYKNNNLNEFIYLGRKYETEHIHIESRTPIFKIEENVFRVYLHRGIPEKTKGRYLEKHFEDKLLEVTKDFFEKWERNLGVSKKSLEIKKMKGKWGYCHTRNHEICLNLDLIKKDLKFIEYVVLHELCHILVPNHGPKFKNLLNNHMPEWKKIVKEFSI